MSLEGELGFSESDVVEGRQVVGSHRMILQEFRYSAVRNKTAHSENVRAGDWGNVDQRGLRGLSKCEKR